MQCLNRNPALRQYLHRAVLRHALLKVHDIGVPEAKVAPWLTGAPMRSSWLVPWVRANVDRKGVVTGEVSRSAVEQLKGEGLSVEYHLYHLPL